MKKTRHLTWQGKSSACLWVAALLGSSLRVAWELKTAVVLFNVQLGEETCFFFSLKNVLRPGQELKKRTFIKTWFRCLGGRLGFKKSSGVLDDGDTALQIAGNWTWFNDCLQNWFTVSSMLVHFLVLCRCFGGSPKRIFVMVFIFARKDRGKSISIFGGFVRYPPNTPKW